LNLAASADGGKYPANVVRKIARHILKDGVSVSSQSERTLRITRDDKIRMVQDIENVYSTGDFQSR
jgi:hypothetical protein